MEGIIKLKMLVDKKLVGTSAYLRMIKALQKQKALIESSTGGRLTTEWEIVEHEYNIDDKDWVVNRYKKENMYIQSASWVQRMTDEYRGDADFLQMILHQDSWKPPIGRIGGFNMFETQVIQSAPWWSVQAWFVTLEEELVHSFDQIASSRLNVNFNKMFDVRSYDNAVVHAEDARYIRSKFGHIYKKAVDVLIKLFPNEKTMIKLIRGDKRPEVYAYNAKKNYKAWVNSVVLENWMGELWGEEGWTLDQLMNEYVQVLPQEEVDVLVEMDVFIGKVVA